MTGEKGYRKRSGLCNAIDYISGWTMLFNFVSSHCSKLTRAPSNPSATLFIWVCGRMEWGVISTPLLLRHTHPLLPYLPFNSSSPSPVAACSPSQSCHSAMPPRRKGAKDNALEEVMVPLILGDMSANGSGVLELFSVQLPLSDVFPIFLQRPLSQIPSQERIRRWWN